MKKSPYIKRLEWEKPYLEALISTLKPEGDILEVGFAQGYAAELIQSLHPKTHTIIESKEEVIPKARDFVKSHPNVLLIEGKWEEEIDKLKVFDTVFFNDPLFSHVTPKVKEEAGLYLQKEKELFNKVYNAYPNLTSIRYSDKDLEDFYDTHGRLGSEYLPNFLAELLGNGQITLEQYKNFNKKHQLKEQACVAACLPIAKGEDRAFAFLQSCLKGHVRKGGRITFFCANPTSKYEDPSFFDCIIANPQFDYEEAMIPVSPPTTCHYYSYQEALVPLVTNHI